MTERPEVQNEIKRLIRKFRDKTRKELYLKIANQFKCHYRTAMRWVKRFS